MSEKNVYKVGEIVQHKLKDEWLFVVGFEDGKILCRTKQLDIKSFHNFELEKASHKKNK